MKPSISFPGPPMALASAALFGASTPLAKLLLGGGVDPWLLAGLLYLGSGLGLGLIHLGRRGLGVSATYNWRIISIIGNMDASVWEPLCNMVDNVTLALALSAQRDPVAKAPSLRPS